MRFCTKCGSALYADSRFCHVCGQEVKALTRQQTLQEIEGQWPGQVAPPAPYPDHTVQERPNWRSRVGLYLEFACEVSAALGPLAEYLAERDRQDADDVADDYADSDDSDVETIGVWDEGDTCLDEAPSAGSDRRVAGSHTSALPRGRMRETDLFNGRDSPLPNGPGIYHHVNKATREVDYVGQTNNLRVRQQQHASSGKLDSETHFVRFATAKETATKDDLCQTEIAHIARHSPPGNTTKGGNGRQ
jgi:hypothetical protein